MLAPRTTAGEYSWYRCIYTEGVVILDHLAVQPERPIDLAPMIKCCWGMTSAQLLLDAAAT